MTICPADMLNAGRRKTDPGVLPGPLQVDDRLSQRCQFDARKIRGYLGEFVAAGGSIAQSFRENKNPAEAGIL